MYEAKLLQYSGKLRPYIPTIIFSIDFLRNIFVAKT